MKRIKHYRSAATPPYLVSCALPVADKALIPLQDTAAVGVSPRLWAAGISTRPGLAAGRADSLATAIPGASPAAAGDA